MAMRKKTLENQKRYLGEITRDIIRVLKKRDKMVCEAPEELIKAVIVTGDVQIIDDFYDGGLVVLDGLRDIYDVMARFNCPVGNLGVMEYIS